MAGYRRILFIGALVTALGVVISTTSSERTGPLGTVFIAIGGGLFIAGMSRKKKEEGTGSGKRE